MSSHAFAGGPEVFPLRGGRAVVLDETGVRHFVFPSRQVVTPYEEITHLTTSRRGLRLAAVRSVYTLARGAFEDPKAPEQLRRALLLRVRDAPGGRARLVQMAQAEVRAQHPPPLRAIGAVAGLCGIGFLLQLLPIGPWTAGSAVQIAADFRSELVAQGQLWRLVTPNLLHGGLIHLALNLLGLFAVGALVEWPLGAARTLFILGVSGLGAMLASYVAGYESALGASGMVAGLVGAAVWLELAAARKLPAIWRVPRRLLMFAIALQAGIELTVYMFPSLLRLVLPGTPSLMIASAAHLGGFVVGLLAAALVAGANPRRSPGRRLVLAADVGLVLATLLSVGLAASQVLRPGELLAYAGHQLLEEEQPNPRALNNTAWELARLADVTPEQVDLALRLAELAVRATGRSDPGVLDTLAEVQFAAGQTERALATIDEAIALAPHEDYYREQRRRFTGERARDDYPPPPAVPALPPLRPPRAPPPEEREIQV